MVVVSVPVWNLQLHRVQRHPRNRAVSAPSVHAARLVAAARGGPCADGNRLGGAAVPAVAGPAFERRIRRARRSSPCCLPRSMVFYLCGSLDARAPRSAATHRRSAPLPIAVFGVGLLPSLPPSPPPPWRSEAAARPALVAALAVVVFLLAWRHVARLRCRRCTQRASTRAALRAGCRCVATTSNAVCVAGGRPVLVRMAVFGTRVASAGRRRARRRHRAVLVARGAMRGDSLRLLLGTLATPIMLAIPVGHGVRQAHVLVGGPCRARIRRHSSADRRTDRRDQDEGGGRQRGDLVAAGALFRGGVAVPVGESRCR